MVLGRVQNRGNRAQAVRSSIPSCRRSVFIIIGIGVTSLSSGRRWEGAKPGVGVKLRSR